MSGDEDCAKCHHYRGHPNTRINGRLVFVCSRCTAAGKPVDRRIEEAERRMGA